MIEKFKETIETKELVAVKPLYAFEALFFYTLDVNEEFYFGVEEFDFRLDGYQIRLVEDIEDFAIVNNFSSSINVKEGLLDQIIHYDIDLSSFETIFNYFLEKDEMISIEREYHDEDAFFLIGKVEEVNEDAIYFKSFDVDGKWSEDINYIPFEIITTIRFNSKYINTWKKYI